MTSRDGTAGIRGLLANLRGSRHVGLAEADQREVAKRRNQTALRQFDAFRAGQPTRVAGPGELGGAEAKPAHHRLQLLLDEAAHPGIRADAGEDDQLAAYPQHAGEFVEGSSGLGTAVTTY